MIVQCDKCRTKFRIADGKVTHSGVKVRCSRCAHVFVVRPDPTASGAFPVPRLDPRGHDTTRIAPGDLASLAATSEPTEQQLTSPGSGLGIRPSRTTQEVAAFFGFSGLPTEVQAPPQSEAKTVHTKVASSPAKVASSPAVPGPPPLPKRPPLPSFPSPGEGSNGLRFPPPLDDDDDDDSLRQGLEDALGAISGLEGSSGFADDGYFPPPPELEAGASLPSSGDLGDIPGLLGAASEDDPFAEVDREVGSQPAYSSIDEGDDSLPAFHELGDGSPLSGLPGAQPLARIHLGHGGIPNFADQHHHLEETAIAAAYGLAQRPAPQPLPEVGDGIGRWPTLLGLAVGAFIVAFVYPGLADGLLHQVVPGAGPTTGASALSTVAAEETFVASYPTASGRLLVVEGIAHNRGDTRLPGVEAVVVLVDGGREVARQSAPVGLPLSEDLLSQISAAKDLPGAYDQAQMQHGVEDLSLSPDGRRGFTVVFPTVPPGADQGRFRIEFVQSAVRTARAGATDAASPP